jgi:peptide chain release factor 2
MLIDDIQLQLKTLEPDIETIRTCWANTKTAPHLEELEALSTEETFWQNPKQTEILKELQRLKVLNEQYTHVTHTFTETRELVELFQDDEEELKKIAAELHSLKKAIVSFKLSLLLTEPNDAANCFISINSGAGGTESQDWANMILRMYVRFCEREKFSVEVLDHQVGEEAGIKSATLFVKGRNPYGLLKGEQGIHRLVRISPFDANKRRHTSFVAVYVAPEIADAEISIDPNDLRIDTFRAGGAGGQHVNKTDSAVRITHLPSGIVVQCQNERSQTQNKETSLKMLRAKLAERQKEEKLAATGKIEKKKIEWGSQIRSYVLHPYKMVKDHRTDFESPQPDLVLDGTIVDFIESYLVWRSAQENA